MIVLNICSLAGSLVPSYYLFLPPPLLFVCLSACLSLCPVFSSFTPLPLSAFLSDLPSFLVSLSYRLFCHLLPLPAVSLSYLLFCHLPLLPACLSVLSYLLFCDIPPSACLSLCPIFSSVILLLLHACLSICSTARLSHYVSLCLRLHVCFCLSLPLCLSVCLSSLSLSLSGARARARAPQSTMDGYMKLNAIICLKQFQFFCLSPVCFVFHRLNRTHYLLQIV